MSKKRSPPGGSTTEQPSPSGRPAGGHGGAAPVFTDAPGGRDEGPQASTCQIYLLVCYSKYLSLDISGIIAHKSIQIITES